MNNNGRPLTNKQTVRILVALTLLVWATQTLLAQWAHGETFATDGVQPKESFVGGSANGGTTLQLISEATIAGSEVTLKQVCRWAERDKSIFDPIGDLVVGRISEGTPFRNLSLDEIRGMMHDAGINISSINFCGAVSCTVSRTDVNYDEKTSLAAWAGTKNPQPDSSVIITGPASAPSADSTVQTLRVLLLNDLATNLNLPVESLQVDFKMNADNFINCAKPLFSFDIDSTNARKLGSISWLVAITRGGSTKKTVIYANARAWQDQVLASKPLSFHQIIRQDDVTTKRELVIDLGNGPAVKIDQVVGQLASREMKPGQMFSGKCVDPLELVKTGQFVSITVAEGNVQIKTVGRAIESGTFGQTIRVKNEQTTEVMQVVITGPQTAVMGSGSTIEVAEGHKS